MASQPTEKLEHERVRDHQLLLSSIEHQVDNASLEQKDNPFHNQINVRIDEWDKKISSEDRNNFISICSSETRYKRDSIDIIRNSVVSNRSILTSEKYMSFVNLSDLNRNRFRN